jgi:hypothetical protein
VYFLSDSVTYLHAWRGTSSSDRNCLDKPKLSQFPTKVLNTSAHSPIPISHSGYSFKLHKLDTSDQLSPPQTAVSSYDLIGLDTVRLATECLRVATVCCCAVPFMALCEISTQPSMSSFEQRVYRVLDDISQSLPSLGVAKSGPQLVAELQRLVAL